MNRWLYAYRYVRGDPPLLEQRLLDTRALLAAALPHVADDVSVDGSLLVDLPAGVAGLEVAKRARIRTGVAHRTGNRLLLPISWRADPARAAFPAFAGHLEWEPLSTSHAQLGLAGTYRAPLGPLGAAVAAAGMHQIAQRTAETVLERIARTLEEPLALGEVLPDGRLWPLRVRDVMTADPLMLDQELPVKAAALLLFHAGISGAPVVAEDGRLVGVVSERDLLAKEAPERLGFGRTVSDDRRRREARTVAEACTSSPVTTVPDARLADAASEMLSRDISRLVVIDQGRVVGIVTRHDVLAALVRADADVYAAVEERLRDFDASDVRIEVDWGRVALTGSVAFRSSRASVAASARAVDGVMEVDATGLTWQVDDVVPAMPMT